MWESATLLQLRQSVQKDDYNQLLSTVRFRGRDMVFDGIGITLRLS